VSKVMIFDATNVCRCCQQAKPISDFGSHKGTKTGYSYKCKSCCSAAGRAHRRDRREKYGVYDDTGKLVAKICSGCSQQKEFDKFYVQKGGLGKRSSRCRPCSDAATIVSRNKNLPRQRVYDRAYYERTKAKRPAYYLKKLYGITVEIYEQMVVDQRGVCAICGSAPTGKRNFTKLHVDHDHVTSRVRGLLCGRCNLAIGMLADNQEHLFKALEYLEKWSK
jgi:hypothetical protein